MRGRGLLLGERGHGVGRLRRVEPGAVRGVESEFVLCLRLRGVHGFRRGIDHRLLGSALTAECRELLLCVRDFPADGGLSFAALSEQRLHLLAGVVQRFDQLAALDLLNPRAREHAEHAELTLAQIVELRRRLLQRRVHRLELAARIAEQLLDQTEQIATANHWSSSLSRRPSSPRCIRARACRGASRPPRPAR